MRTNGKNSNVYVIFNYNTKIVDVRIFSFKISLKDLPKNTQISINKDIWLKKEIYIKKMGRLTCVLRKTERNEQSLRIC